MDSTEVVLEEQDVLKLVLGFLETRGYHGACRALELQLGVVEEPHDDRAHMQFLRNLVLDGRWEDVVTFVEPLKRSKPQEHAALHFKLLQQWYFELLVGWTDVECGSDAEAYILTTASERHQLNQLETCVVQLKGASPTPSAFTRLTDIAASPNLMAQPELQGWTLEGSRVQLASDAIKAVNSVLFGLGPNSSAAENGDHAGGRVSPTVYDGNRLVELVGKGLCFNGPENFSVQLATADGTKPVPVRRASDAPSGADAAAASPNAAALLGAPHVGISPSPTFPSVAPAAQHMTVPPYATHLDQPTAASAPPPAAWASEPSVKTGTDAQGPRISSTAAAAEEPGHERLRKSLTAIDHIRASVARANAIEDHGVHSPTGYGTVVVSLPQKQTANPTASSLASSTHRSEKPMPRRITNTVNNNPATTMTTTTSLINNNKPTDASAGAAIAPAPPTQQHRAQDYDAAVLSPTPVHPAASIVPVPAYQELSRLDDSQAIRAAEFSPSGAYLAIGSNSAQIRVCLTPVRRDAEGCFEWGRPPAHEFGGAQGLAPLSTVWSQKKYHRGSIYCIRWNKTGDIIATGSNDKVVQLQRFDGGSCTAVDTPLIIKPHSGTVRSLAFVNGGSGTELLVTGGGGDFSVGVHDSLTGQTVARMEGHAGAVNALACMGSDHPGMVASASADGTVKLWDARAGYMASSFSVASSAATAIAGQGNQLAFGCEDGSLSLLDSRMGHVTHGGANGRGPHEREVKSLQYAPVGAHRHLLLSCSYDGSVGISQAEESGDIKTTKVAWHDDKIISARWCPLDAGQDFPGFVTASADRTVKLWTPDS